MEAADKIKVEKERATLKATLKVLRPIFPGLPDSEILLKVLREAPELNPESLTVYAKKTKRFSTADVMQHFSVSKYAVAGSVATLRRSGVLVQDSPDKDDQGYACWKFSGKK